MDQFWTVITWSIPILLGAGLSLVYFLITRVANHYLDPGHPLNSTVIFDYVVMYFLFVPFAIFQIPIWLVGLIKYFIQRKPKQETETPERRTRLAQEKKLKGNIEID
jgi:hypothetical protein